MMDGTILRTGGPVMKSSSGYDLTQLLIGSEGTLAIVTEITLKLSPILPHSATMLVPFNDVHAVTSVVPTLISAGLLPSLLEYLDVTTMHALQSGGDLHLGVDPAIAEASAAYLIVVLETRTREQLDADLEAAAELLGEAGALDIYVLEGTAASQLIQARERAFWLTKAAGANEILDIVVPRSSVPTFLEDVAVLADKHGAYIAGCGHVGDGNVHLTVFQPDDERRHALLQASFELALAVGGAISGEHGIGTAKLPYFLELADPVALRLMRAIKAAFDPQGILGPDRLLGVGREGATP